MISYKTKKNASNYRRHFLKCINFGFGYTIPCANMASATLTNPAMFAPLT